MDQKAREECYKEIELLKVIYVNTKALTQSKNNY